MIARKLFTLVSVSSLLMLGGCAAHINSPFDDNSRVDAAWGNAREVTRADQLANPEAPMTDAGPEGMDASTGERVADRYYRGQEAQQTRRARTVSIAE
jgi:hypothetical protein